MIIERIIVGSMETNCFIVYDEKSLKALLIDPGGDTEKIKRVIKRRGIDCVAILNTHGHIDHIAGNNDFEIPIIIHEEDEAFLYNPELNLSLFWGNPFVSRKAERKVRDGERINIEGMVFKVIHTPGHTPGSICLNSGKVLFSGDTIFAQGIGRTDFPHSSEKDLLYSLKEKIFTLPPEIEIYPGHGPFSTLEREKGFFR